MFLRRLLGFLRRERGDDRLNEELQMHLDALAAENLRRGMPPEEARQAARREFGGLEQVREAYRDQRGLPFLDALVQDVQWTLRMLAKRPAGWWIT